MQDAELGAEFHAGLAPLPLLTLALDLQGRLERVVEELHDIAPPLLVEFERNAVDDRLRMVEAAGLAGIARGLQQLRERAAQRLAAECRR